MKYLIAGLGNIGDKYELTRHNIGFLILDQLMDKNKEGFLSNLPTTQIPLSWQADKLSIKSELKYKGRTLHFIKPATFVNLSGKAVNYWIKKLKIPLENLLVITDDISLPFGKIRIRAKGSSGGHNGLISIESALSTSVYTRLRFGIGSNFSKGRQVEYVLSNFTKEEFSALPKLMDKVNNMIYSFCTVGVERTMTEFN